MTDFSALLEPIADDLLIARAVITQEIAGLQALEEALDGRFVSAVELLLRIKGRVILSGIGKSGHIARKIASTLSSTGTPAQFVHASEASHGDLGTVTAQDAVCIFSNSGETNELSDLVYYTRRFSIPLIAVVAVEDSELARAADFVLLLPKVKEASSLSAPTTSSLMMLALGDALAVTLHERKGFTRSDFQNFHPGGRLGVAFKKVADIMHKGDSVPLVKSTSKMAEALMVMTSKTLGCTGVSDDGVALLGIITDGDLRRNLQNNLLEMNAAEVMTRNPRTIEPGAMAAEALEKMQALAITSLFVLEKGQIQGVIHIHDCLRAGVA